MAVLPRVSWPRLGRPFDRPLQLLDIGDERYASFESAVTHLKNFVREQDISGQVSLIPRSDLTILGQNVYVAQGSPKERSTQVRREYEAAMRSRLGVSLNVACRFANGNLAAYVYSPRDADWAMRLMHRDGVKYTVPVEIREGFVVGRFQAKVLQTLRRNVKRIRDAQEFLK